MDPSFVHGHGDRAILSLVASPFQLRRSLDLTLTEALTEEGYGCHLDDIDRPQHFLHGTGASSIEGMDEIWTTHSSIASWAAWYSFPEAIPHFSFGIPLQGTTTVIGYAHLLSTTAPVDKEQVSTLCNPFSAFVPSCMGQSKVVARRSYWAKFLFGNFPSCKPDAFIFKGDVIRAMGLKVSHTFRIVVRRDAGDAA